MRGRLRSHLWSCAALSLIVLTTNIGAPFQTSDLRRAVLDGHWRHVATQSVIRVRVVSQVGVSLGFRAVVGLAKGGPDPDGPRANVQARPAFPRTPTDHAPRRRSADLAVARPTPPLRC